MKPENWIQLATVIVAALVGTVPLLNTLLSKMLDRANAAPKTDQPKVAENRFLRFLDKSGLRRLIMPVGILVCVVGLISTMMDRGPVHRWTVFWIAYYVAFILYYIVLDLHTDLGRRVAERSETLSELIGIVKEQQEVLQTVYVSLNTMKEVQIALIQAVPEAASLLKAQRAEQSPDPDYPEYKGG